MHVYRFRMFKVDQEDFIRDFDIKANQTFKDLHDVIHNTTKFNGKELSSFYICNQNWKKLKEITLIDMNDEISEDDEEEKVESKPKTTVMDQARIKDFIDDPHQRLIYEYDFLNPQTFYMELTKVISAENNINYPLCSNRKGDLEIKPVTVPDLNMDDMAEESLNDYSDYLNEDIEL